MKVYALDGSSFDRETVGAHGGCVRPNGTCCGCGEPVGQEHDLACDHEICPRCAGQMGTCNCDALEMPWLAPDGAEDIIHNLSAALRDTIEIGGE